MIKFWERYANKRIISDKASYLGVDNNEYISELGFLLELIETESQSSIRKLIARGWKSSFTWKLCKEEHRDLLLSLGIEDDED